MTLLIKNLAKTLAMAGLVSAVTLASPAFAEGNKAIATGLLTKGLVLNDKSFINQNVVKGYIQHNPVAQDGRAGLLGFADYLKSLKTSISIKPVRVLEDGNLVMIQSAYDLGGEKIVFDLFRFENGKIVEHWDATQDKPEKTVSGRTMLDGTTEITDRKKTAENRTLVTNFVTDILVNGEGGKITNYIGDTYLQHNPNIADGLDGLDKFLGYLKENKISFSYKKIHNVVAEGNFVFTQSEGVIGGKANAFYDLFRVEGGKIVEHWDVIQEIPTQMPHGNGMF